MTVVELRVQLALGTLTYSDKIGIICDTTSKEILRILFNQAKDWCTKDHIAENRNTPIDILEKLSRDESIHVRCRVAENINTPIDILEKLGRDENVIRTVHEEHRQYCRIIGLYKNENDC